MVDRDRRDGYALYARDGWAEPIVARRSNWRCERVSAGSPAARLLWEQTCLPRSLQALGIDVLHSTHHTLPLTKVRARRVVTVHDLTFFRIPDRYPPARRLYMQTLTRLSASVAEAIIVPSKAVRDDVTRVLRIPSSKIAVVYEAAALQYRPIAREDAAAIAREHGIEGAYVLSVGSLEPGKNRARLIEALRRLRDAGIDYRLVIVGQQAWKYDSDFALVDALGMRDRVMFLGYVKQEHMPALYSGAIAFAFPSLYEGFGLGVVEAMACGTPVLTSSISATAEVAGDAAVLVDPALVADIADGLRRLLTDPALRADLSRRGLVRASQFSWRRAADETHAVYAATVAGESPSR